MATETSTGKNGKKSEGWAGAPQSKASRKFEKVDSEFFKFDEIGKSLEGTLAERGTQTFQNGSITGRYKVMNDDGELIGFLGATDLDDKLKRIELGEYIRITFTGTQKAGAGTMKVFDVERAVE